MNYNALIDLIINFNLWNTICCEILTTNSFKFVKNHSLTDLDHLQPEKLDGNLSQVFVMLLLKPDYFNLLKILSHINFQPPENSILHTKCHHKIHSKMDYFCPLKILFPFEYVTTKHQHQYVSFQDDQQASSKVTSHDISESSV